MPTPTSEGTRPGTPRKTGQLPEPWPFESVESWRRTAAASLARSQARRQDARRRRKLWAGTLSLAVLTAAVVVTLLLLIFGRPSWV